MQLLPPFDKIGVTPVPDHVNASPQAGIPGSILNCQVFNALQHEMQNAIAAQGLPPTDSDYTQLIQAISSGAIWIGTFGGTPDALTATIPLPAGVTIPAVKAGMRISGFIAANNATTNPSLAAIGFAIGSAPSPIKKRNGSAPAVADLVVGIVQTFRADGNGNWLIDGQVHSDATGSATEGVRYSNGTYSWDIPDLTEKDILGNADLFGFYSLADGHHRKTTGAVLASYILSLFSSQSGSALALNPQVIHLEEQRSLSTPPRTFPGAAGTGSWVSRILNTVISNQVTGASLNPSTGRLTLPAGSYRAWFGGCTHSCGFHVTRLYDYTNNVQLGQGLTGDSYIGGGNDVTNASNGVTRFTVSSPIVLGLDHFGVVVGSGGNGVAKMGDDSTGYIPFIDAYLHLEKENGQ